MRGKHKAVLGAILLVSLPLLLGIPRLVASGIEKAGPYPPPQLPQMVGATTTHAVKSLRDSSTLTTERTPDVPRQDAVRAALAMDGVSILGNAQNSVAASSSVQLLQNPGFDSGLWTPWQVSGDPYLATVFYHSASYSAWLAGYDNANDIIYQTVSVPDDTAGLTLDLWARFESQESQWGGDWFCVDITDNSFDTLIGGPYCYDLFYQTQNQWLNASAIFSAAQLSPLLGQSVRVVLFAQTDSAEVSSVWLDDVTLTATAAQGQRIFIPFVAREKPATPPQPSQTPIAFWSFSSRYDSKPDIYIMDTDGTGRERITDEAATDTDPAWSPQGDRIAYVSSSIYDYFGTEIYVMNADGSGRIRLTWHTSPDSHPTWSPDGNRIAFGSMRNTIPSIYVVNADGSGGLTWLTGNWDGEPDWSPDGSHIAFMSNRDGNQEIYVMNANGSAPQRLTVNAAADTSPDWSPDGNRIAFSSNRDGNWEIYVINADGSGLQRLTNSISDDTAPDWSSNGSCIAFSSISIPDGNYEIYTMNADGSDWTQLTDNDVPDYAPSW